MVKKYFIIIFLLSLLYTLFTLIEFKFQPYPAYCDGYWYIKVAQNIALGKGFVEDIVLYHFPKIEKMKEFPHPIGNYWNPLNSIILAGFYKLFGISELTPKLSAFIIDLIITLMIFFIAKKILDGNIILAFFVSLIYVIHPLSITIRGLSGLPETYTTLFMIPMAYFLFLSLTKSKNYIVLSSFFGGLSYLSRNESGSYIILLFILLFLEKDYKKNLKYLFIGVFVFFLVVSWWEIRNFIVFGKHSGEMKRNLLLCNEFFDFMCFDKNWTIQEWLSDGFMNVIVRKFASLYYKLETFVTDVNWLLVMFFIFSIPKNINNILFRIVSLYILLTYLLTGILFSFTQRSGWHAHANFLPYIILFALSGIKEFVLSFNLKNKNLYIFLLLLLVFTYFLGNNIKRYKDISSIGRRDFYKEVSQDIIQYFNSQNIKNAKIFVNDAYIISYYTGYNLIQIPFDKTIDSLKKAIMYYKPDYIILTGYYPMSTTKLYQGEIFFDWLELVMFKKYDFIIPVTDGRGGSELKIYRVKYDKI